MTNNKISVLLHTHNEERNIRNCLESIKWADEIVIVDMESNDKTLEIAKKYMVKIYPHKNLGYADPARQFGLEKTSNKWILAIDADEMVPLALKNELFKIMSSDIADVVEIPHNNYFFGKKLKATGWGPLQDYHYRFFKKSFFTYSADIHNFANIAKHARKYKIKDANAGFIHFNYLTIEHFLEKMNRYTTIEAMSKFEQKTIPKKIQLFWPAYKEFKSRFWKRKGYKDGFIGFALSLLMGFYKISTNLKLWLIKEYEDSNTNAKIELAYQEIAEKILTEYK